MPTPQSAEYDVILLRAGPRVGDVRSKMTSWFREVLASLATSPLLVHKHLRSLDSASAPADLCALSASGQDIPDVHG
jgi:hypothetical protein